jgi:hypothetical protein
VSTYGEIYFLLKGRHTPQPPTPVMHPKGMLVLFYLSDLISKVLSHKKDLDVCFHFSPGGTFKYLMCISYTYQIHINKNGK